MNERNIKSISTIVLQNTQIAARKRGDMSLWLLIDVELCRRATQIGIGYR